MIATDGLEGPGAVPPADALPSFPVGAPALDPLARVEALGGQPSSARVPLGVALALLVHAAASVSAVATLTETRGLGRAMREAIQDHLRVTYEIEAEQQPKPEPPPEPEEPEEPELTPPPPPPPRPADDPYEAPPDPARPPPDDPYDEPPPAPAEAAKVLTDDSPAPTGAPTFVTGEGQGPGYGMVSAAGTATTPTFRRSARVGGVPGGRGTGTGGAPRKDRSRKADLLGDRAWDCPFPTEADALGVDDGVVTLLIEVRPDGRAQRVTVLKDPGHGFGRVARSCAAAHHYRPALDSDGKPISATIGPIRVRFTR